MPPKGKGKQSSSSEGEAPLDKFLEKNSSPDVEVTNSDLKKIMASLFEKLQNTIDQRMSTVETSIKNSLSDIKNEFLEIQKTLLNYDDRITELESNKGQGEQNCKKINELENKLEVVENQLAYYEQRSRKYNLLFYGIDRKDHENPSAVIKEFLRDILKLSPSTLDSISIQNAHRIPRNPDNVYKPSAPEAIIVRFCRMEDRNYILSKCWQTPMPKGKAIRSDLPGPLKKKRSELAHTAYELRRRNLWKTRIVESRNDVHLEVREKKDTAWRKYCPTIESK